VQENEIKFFREIDDSDKYLFVFLVFRIFRTWLRNLEKCLGPVRKKWPMGVENEE
jgi:hypothetical protein